MRHPSDEKTKVYGAKGYLYCPIEAVLAHHTLLLWDR